MAHQNGPPEKFWEKVQKRPVSVCEVCSGTLTWITNPKQQREKRRGFYLVLHHIFTESWTNLIQISQYLFEPGPTQLGTGGYWRAWVKYPPSNKDVLKVFDQEMKQITI